jgi:hypothetical protein
MKLTKGKISKLYNKKKQSLKKGKKDKKSRSIKRNTFRKNKGFNLARKTLKKYIAGNGADSKSANIEDKKIEDKITNIEPPTITTSEKIETSMPSKTSVETFEPITLDNQNEQIKTEIIEPTTSEKIETITTENPTVETFDTIKQDNEGQIKQYDDEIIQENTEPINVENEQPNTEIEPIKSEDEIIQEQVSSVNNENTEPMYSETIQTPIENVIQNENIQQPDQSSSSQQSSSQPSPSNSEQNNSDMPVVVEENNTVITPIETEIKNHNIASSSDNKDNNLNQAVNTIINKITDQIADKIISNKDNNIQNYDAISALTEQAEKAATSGGKQRTKNFRLIKKSKQKKNKTKSNK